MMNIDELEAEAMKLDLLTRTELARRLTASLTAAPAVTTTQTADERERLWIQEAMRRSRELREAQPASPPAPPRAQADLVFSPRAAAAPRAPRKKPASRATRPVRRKPAKRLKPPARHKRAKPTRLPKAKAKAKTKPKPRQASRSRR